MIFMAPPQIKMDTIKIEGCKNDGFKKGDIINISGLNNEIFIEDKADNFKCSFYDLANKDILDNNPPYICTKSFVDGWILCKENRYKIKKITFEYEPAKQRPSDNFIYRFKKGNIGNFRRYNR
jgi:hypothetical protein